MCRERRYRDRSRESQQQIGTTKPGVNLIDQWRYFLRGDGSIHWEECAGAGGI